MLRTSSSRARTRRISAYAGLNLSIYGKAGLTILKHDIDFIAKITGSAGIKAYAEARPTIGYREKADPLAGKKGEAYLQGHLEAAAQPVLGLSGDLEVKLSSPWWSPAPKKTWTWPLFSLEWPIGSGIGIGAFRRDEPEQPEKPRRGQEEGKERSCMARRRG